MALNLLSLFAKTGTQEIGQVAKTPGLAQSVSSVIDPLTEYVGKVFGPVGEEFKEQVEQAVTRAVIRAGKTTSIYDKAVERVSDAEWESVAKSLAGKTAVPAGANQANAYTTTRALTDAMFMAADKVGIPRETDVEFVDNYFPQFFKDTSKFFRGGEKRQAVINSMVAKGVLPNEADRILDSKLSQEIRTKIFGPLDFRRTTPIDDEFLRWDKQVLHHYTTGWSRRVSFAERFGPANEKVMEMSLRLPKEQRQDFIDIANMIIGPTGRLSRPERLVSPIWDRIRSPLARSMMAFSSLSNMWQGAYGSFIRTGTANTLKAINAYWKGHDAEFIRKSGVITSELAESFNAFADDSDFFKKTLFWQTERANRTVAGLAGKYYLEDLYKSLQSGSKTARKEMLRLGLKPDAILQKGLREDDMLTAAVRIVHETQFRFAPESMPLMAQSPLGKVLYSMQSFNVNQLNFFRNFVLRELREGNPLPLMRTVGMGYFVGMGNRMTWASLTGKQEKERESIGNMWKNLAYSGSMGLMSDLMQGAPRGMAIMPPIISILNDFFQAMSKVPEGDINPITKLLGRRLAIPAIIGALPQQVAFPAAIASRMALERATAKE